MDTQRVGVVVLRYGLAMVFLYFGFSQLMQPAVWAGIVPQWALALSGLSGETVVRINGVFEVAAAALLLLGVWVRYVAAVLALHIAPIALTLGLEPEGVRDFGLAAASLALALIEGGRRAA
jgi:uncharacterized membrane protein YphA (DoxX/SURF4 family)